MQCRRCAGDLGQPQNVIADQVFHRYVTVPRAVTQRPAGDRPDMLFELVDGATVLRPVSRIMDSRGDFIDDRACGGHEQFDTQNADIVVQIGSDGVLPF